jgi:hypothetical protein
MVLVGGIASRIASEVLKGGAAELRVLTRRPTTSKSGDASRCKQDLPQKYHVRILTIAN